MTCMMRPPPSRNISRWSPIPSQSRSPGPNGSGSPRAGPSSPASGRVGTGPPGTEEPAGAARGARGASGSRRAIESVIPGLPGDTSLIRVLSPERPRSNPLLTCVTGNTSVPGYGPRSPRQREDDLPEELTLVHGREALAALGRRADPVDPRAGARLLLAPGDPAQLVAAAHGGAHDRELEAE